MEDPEDIEERCGNAVFEVCDARERYPKRCAEELDKYLNSKNNIAMEPVVLKPLQQIFEIPAALDTRGKGTSGEGRDTISNTSENNAEKLKIMINKVHELKVALKQLEDNRNFEIKHNLK